MTLATFRSTARLALILLAAAQQVIHHASAFHIQQPTLAFSSTSSSQLQMVSFQQTNPDLISLNENTPRDITSFEQWAESCGIQRSPSLQLFGTPDVIVSNHMDVYAYSSDSLPEQSLLLQVPGETILSSNRAIAEIGRMEDVEDTITSLNAGSELRQFYLLLYILVEYEKGPESPWYSYLNSLPRYYTNAASMTSFCYTCLPPLASKLAMKERTKLNHLTGAAIKRIPFLSEETKYNYDLLKWAFQIVYTRSYEDPNTGDIKVIPMVDMFNHGANPNVEIAFDEEGNCYAQTLREVQEGEPLTLQYGDPTNPSHLFARYGFLDESSQATFCKLIPPHVNEDMKVLGYAENRMLFFMETGDASQEVWDNLLYQTLSSTNIKAKRDFFKAHVDEDWQTKQMFHEQYYPETSAKLLEHIDSTLSLLDRLEQQTGDKDVSDHPRIPVILGHNNFVRETFMRVRNRYFS